MACTTRFLFTFSTPTEIWDMPKARSLWRNARPRSFFRCRCTRALHKRNAISLSTRSRIALQHRPLLEDRWN